MPHRMKPSNKEPRREVKKEKASGNIVRLTLTDKERVVMERITKATSKESSEIIREAFSFWISRRQRLCLDM